MNMPQCQVTDESGAVQWSGSLHRFLVDNAFTADEAARYTLNPIRESGRASCGGGAAPAFYVSLAKVNS